MKCTLLQRNRASGTCRSLLLVYILPLPHARQVLWLRISEPRSIAEDPIQKYSYHGFMDWLLRWDVIEYFDNWRPSRDFL